MLADYKEMFGWGKMLRSAPMEYISVVLQEHLAHDVVERLGGLGVVQFTDLNGDLTAFKRFYTPYIRRCDELEKKLKFFEEEMVRAGVEVAPITPGEFTVWRQSQLDTVHREHRGLGLLDYWEAIINERHRDYVAVKSERDRTGAALYSAAQRRFVIEKASEFFALDGAAESSGAGTGIGAGSVDAAALEGGRGGRAEEDDMAFRHIAGILPTEDKGSFERIVFRASAGHAVVRFSDIPGDLVDDKGGSAPKSVFAVFFRGKTLAPKLDRICTAFGAHTHDIPNFGRPGAVAAALEEAKGAIEDGIAWMDQERATSGAALAHLSLVVSKWLMGVQREKAIYHTLNCFTRNSERGTVHAQGWVLASATGSVQEAIKSVHVGAAQGGRVQPFFFEVVQPGVSGAPSSPPTHFTTNKFTKVFQAIVNTYGVPRYGEANPALFSIATFPFLFGVMFGDMGHASVLTMAAAWMVWSEEALLRKKLHEIMAMAFKGRYMLLLMGFFSIYCGLIYNDAFSLGTTLMGKSNWWYPPNADGTPGKEATWGKTAGDVYPFGIDPEWHNSENDLLYFNSLKMKMSVILGITQMSFGLFLKLSNSIHFGNKVEMWLEVVPQLIFMLGLFGYMIILIVMKWGIDWSAPDAPGAPPGLIDTLINIALKPGTISDKMYDGQGTFQVLLLLTVFFCVPIMLVGKPYFMAKAAKEAHGAHGAEKKDEAEGAGLLAAAGSGPSRSSGTAAAVDTHEVLVSTNGGAGADGMVAKIEEPHHDAHAAAAGGGGHEEHGFGELLIHQAIETIEFVLGCVSNTASYLRLWALSLAHSQLATVFWERALVSTVEMNSALFVFIGYAIFSGVSVGVLMIMDVLECFLHALRLHWVEFQNKFYKADGHKFTPFSFEAIAEAAKEAEGK